MNSKRKQSAIKSLPIQELAQLYLQLERLQKAGIPSQESLALLTKNKGEIGQRANKTLTYLKRGKPLAEAGQRAGLFVGLDAVLIKIAESGGIYTEVFHQLAQFYEEQTRYQRQLKSKLVWPLVVLLLAIFIQPIPMLISGQISAYLGMTVGLIIQMVVFIFIVLHLPRWLRLSLGKRWDKMQTTIPYWGRWYVRRTLRDFMRSLGLMLQAGLPILDALPKAYETIDNYFLRQQLQQITTYLRVGNSFAEAIAQIEVIDPIATQLISTGDHSGTLAEMILHYTQLESEAIAQHHDMLAAWLPRLVYALVAIWIIYGILSSNAFTPPPLPE